MYNKHALDILTAQKNQIYFQFTLCCWQICYRQAIFFSSLESVSNPRELNLANRVREEAIRTSSHSFWPPLLQKCELGHHRVAKQLLFSQMRALISTL